VSDPREEIFLSDTVLALLEGNLIRRAGDLYRCGFGRIGAAQMEALAGRIREAATIEKARSDVAAFIRRRTAKLPAQRERSWVTPAATGGSVLTLGELLVDWLANERYLEGVEDDILKLLNRTCALKRFWNRFHGIYRYGTVFGTDTPLTGFRRETT
jgi:hypothetical protein